jgi:hypothetical protein
MWKDNLVAFAKEGFNYDEFKVRGPHETRAVASWNLGTGFHLKLGKPRNLVSAWLNTETPELRQTEEREITWSFTDMCDTLLFTCQEQHSTDLVIDNSNCT